ncbi:MAG: EAL domain-containing protein [Desulfuromonadales bacterium]|nr:EAL domain-containing protein [Desulfuromonadales bacterium]MDW7756215.1 EAL domain-containing protein [Desulfuromonadales bacterium]
MIVTRCFQRISLMIWVLIAIALLVPVMGIVHLTTILGDTQAQRKHLLQTQQEEVYLLKELRSKTHAAKEELNSKLYHTRVPVTDDGQVTSYLQLLEDISQRTPHLGQDAIWAQLEGAADPLSELAREASTWREHYIRVETDLVQDISMNRLQDFQQRLAAAIESAEGRWRLTEARQIRRWRESSGPEAERIARNILEKRGELWFPLLNELSVELNFLSTLVARLAIEKSIDHLHDLKDNQIKPSMDRLEHNILILEEEGIFPAGETLALFNDYKNAIFGQGHRIDHDYQTIEATGGFFRLCQDHLQLQAHRLVLDDAIARHFNQIEAIYPQLAHKTKERVDRLTEAMEAGISQALWRMGRNGALAMTAFLILGTLIRLRIRQQVRRLEKVTRHHNLILNSAGEGIMGLSPDGNTTFINQAGADLLGFAQSELVGQNYLQVVCPSDKKDTPAESPCLIRQVWETGAPARQDSALFYHKDGRAIPVEYICTPILNEEQQAEGAVIAFSDIRERQEAERALLKKKQLLDHLAHHDPLTDLPNRRLFQDRLVHALDRARRTGKEVALLFLDLDRFKKVNDTLGHEMGDKLLAETSGRLRQIVRHSDTLARLGGDEFVLLLEDSENPNHDAVVARKILEQLATPFSIGPHQLYVTASIGISRFPADAVDVKGLTSCADAAMYHAKAKGKNTFQFYTPELNSRAAEFLEMETRLRQALAQDLFTLHYQPQFEIATGNIVGVEALIRWHDPVLGHIPPDRFIPLAEESGLIVPLGNWVLRKACEQNVAWQRQGLPCRTVAVNISGIQFSQSDFVDIVDNVLASTGLDPQWLELEITESTIMEDFSTAMMTLIDLKIRGVQLAIDDFGTGYSSLSYLKQFPVDKLKIDRSFIGDVLHDENASAITLAIMALGRAMHMTIVAEGIEREDQVRFLAENNCAIGQGFFYARPMPAAACEELFRKAQSRNWPVAPVAKTP